MKPNTLLFKTSLMTLSLSALSCLAWAGDSAAASPQTPAVVTNPVTAKTRDQVAAELVQAQRCGEVWSGDSDYPSTQRELHPRQYPATADCAPKSSPPK